MYLGSDRCIWAAIDVCGRAPGLGPWWVFTKIMVVTCILLFLSGPLPFLFFIYSLFVFSLSFSFFLFCGQPFGRLVLAFSL
jgi:hypothetical protein